MSILQNRLGVNLTDHTPVKDSPFSSSTDEGSGLPPFGQDSLITEGGVFILTENGDFLTTE